MRLIVVTAMVALAFASCSKPAAQNEDSRNAELLAAQNAAKAAEEARVAAQAAADEAKRTADSAAEAARKQAESRAAAEAAAAAAAVAEPAPPAPELAPEGVFYLIASTRVETADGIHGLAAGTGVRLVRPGVYLTPAGELSLDEALLTNDLGKARAARNAEVGSQTAIAQRGAADAARAAELAKIKASETQSGHAAALAQIDREKLKQKIAALKQQRIALEGQVEGLRKQSYRDSYAAAIGRTVTSTTNQRMTATQTQLRMVEQQITDAESELSGKR